jgi:hypothetical protein
MPPSILDLVDRALLDVEPIVGDVRPEHYGRPTPCAGFDVRSLTAHLIGGIRATATVAEGGEMRFDDHPDLDHEDATAESELVLEAVGHLELHRADRGEHRGLVAEVGVAQHLHHALLVELGDARRNCLNRPVSSGRGRPRSARGRSSGCGGNVTGSST